MTGNFHFLTDDWADLLQDAVETERNARTAPRTCAFYARRALERAVRWLYAHDKGLRLPYQENLAALIHEPTFRDTLPPGLFNQVRMIHKLGNLAVHSDTSINAQDGVQVTKCLHAVLGWLARAYSRGGAVIAPFDETLLPLQTPSAADRSAAELQTLQAQFAERDRAYAESVQQLAASQEEIDRLRAEIARIKAENEKTIADEEYSEAATRDLFIDLMLREAGWDPHGARVAEYEVAGMPNKRGLGYVDYVLWGDDGLPLALVEAKKTKVDPRAGKRQAELYADCLERQEGCRPVIFYTNGYDTWLWDDYLYPPRAVQGFYTKDELQLMVNRRTSRHDITQAVCNPTIADRPFQREAVQRVTEAFGRDRARAALVVMATGAGKTRLAIATVEILMKANWVRRVLFLADRTALLTQAKRAFNKFLPHASLVNLVEEKENADSRVVFSTYPTMMNSIDDARTDGQKRFGIGHFDLIIIDEAHRSVYQKFGAIFDYFDALLLGLTATPKAEVDRNTYHLFDLEDNVPTFAYELDQAVADGFLVPPRPVSVPLKFQRQGIQYDELSDEEQAAYEETFLDEDTGILPPAIDPAALNKWLFNADTVDKVLAHLMERGLKVQGGDRVGKTIIFAKNHNHAEFIVERFDKNYPHLAGKFCRVIDNTVKYAQSLIDDFYIPAKNPIIAVSVDMLDTGIDVPELVNLVFFKIVRSRTKFWQMVGRGTRLSPGLFGPGRDKENFYLFDYCQNLEFFGERPEGFEASLQESIKEKIFKRRLELSQSLLVQERDGKQSGAKYGELRSDLLDQLHEQVFQLNVENFLVRPHRRYVEEFGQRPRWEEISTGDEIDIIEHLSHLPAPDDDDEFARRFDLLLLNLQLAILEHDPKQPRYQERVRELASGLEEKRAIPSVAAQLELILDLQTDEYWEGVTLPMLEQVRRRLRDLIKFIDRSGGRENVYTDFDDEIGEGVEVGGFIVPDPSFANYRLKVERFIREHQDHSTIRKLHRNEPITLDDVEALERILFSDGGPGTREAFAATFGTDQPLGKLVREIVGLDRTAAKQAFAQFLSAAPLSADQITFIDRIVDHLAANGLMELSELFRPPFTDAHDHGVSGVLPDRATEILRIIETINNNALAA